MARSFLLFAFFSALGLAQTAPRPAPAKAAAPAKPAAAKAKPRATPEAAVRARASKFLQYHVEGDFWKAMDLVADETKKDYFAAGKQKLNSFTIDSIKLTDKNTKAVVTATVKRDWNIRMEHHEVVVPMVTSWKVEKGQWVWYWDKTAGWLTPMGESKVEPPAVNADGTVKLPPKFDSETIAAAARNILGQSGVDKATVEISGAGSSETQVWFTNGVQGVVKASLSGIPNIPGFSASLAKEEVGAGQKVAVTLRYNPPADAGVPEPFVLQVVTEPLNQGYPVRVSFSKPAEK